MDTRSLVCATLSLAASAAMATAHAADPALPALRTELLERVEIDQAMRYGLHLERPVEEVKKAWRRIEVVDHGNTAWLREIVERHGWPSAAAVGDDGAHAAWLLVQHADADPGFQRKCLDLIEALGDSGASAHDVAYLTDRVRIAEGRPQLYGSQLRGRCDSGFAPYPIEDAARVDERRAQKGLQSLGEYLAVAKGFMCHTAAP